MHTHRLATFLVGAWLMGTLLMMFITSQNMRSVDRMMEGGNAPVVKIQDQLGGKVALRQVLRYQVSEANRFLTEWWEYLGIGLGITLTVVVLFATNGNLASMALVTLLLAVAVSQRLFLTPEIVYLGRHLDFLAADAVTPERARFWNYQTAYAATELLKILLGVVLGARLVARSSSSRGQRRRRAEPVVEEAQVVPRTGS